LRQGTAYHERLDQKVDTAEKRQHQKNAAWSCGPRVQGHRDSQQRIKGWKGGKVLRRSYELRDLLHGTAQGYSTKNGTCEKRGAESEEGTMRGQVIRITDRKGRKKNIAALSVRKGGTQKEF